MSVTDDEAVVKEYIAQLSLISPIPPALLMA
jgi:hypothetical protein